MKRTVRLLDQPERFIRSKSPEPRRKLIAGLRALETGHGDSRSLDAPLSGWYRLRVGSFRFIYREVTGNAVQVVFGEHRGVVYDLFAKLLAEKLL